METTLDRDLPVLSESYCWSEAACASSVLLGVFASHPRLFREHNVDSPDGGFSEGTTGDISISRRTSGDTVHLPEGVLRLKWQELSFEGRE
jgi:hypothetical protein